MGKIRGLLSFATIVCVLFIASVLGWQFAIWRMGSPMIEVEESIIDLGIIPSHTDVTRSVEVYNRGNAVLEIAEVRTGCGCIEVAIENGQIAPKCSTKMSITQRGKSPREQIAGETEIFLFSNDRGLPVCRVLARYRASKDFLLEPGQVDFGQISSKRLPAVGKCRIVGPGDNDESVPINSDKVSAFTNVPFLSVTTNRPSSSDVEIQVTINKDAPLGELFYPLQITEVGGKVLFQTNIIGNVKGSFFSLPPAVDMMKVSQGEEANVRVVQFKSRIQGGITTIKDIRVCENLQDMLRVELDQGKASVSLSVDLRRSERVMSTRQHHGYFEALCTDLQGAEYWTCVPVRFSTVGSKF